MLDISQWTLESELWAPDGSSLFQQIGSSLHGCMQVIDATTAIWPLAATHVPSPALSGTGTLLHACHLGHHGK